MTATDWDAYIAAAPNFAAAQDRMEEALAAGVDFTALLAAQAKRAR
jgi:hypothetical protein